MKKLVLLDVDGVLSIERPVFADDWNLPSSSYQANYSGTVKVNIPNKRTTYRTHTYRPDIISSIDYISDNYNIEFKFLTNWGEAASSIFAKYVGLKSVLPMDSDAKDLGVSKPSDTEDPIYWYKAQALLREAKQNNREAIMIDDLIDLQLAKSLKEELPDTCGWLKIHPMVGLTKPWLEHLRLWAEEGRPPIRKHTA